jgi:phosphate transport system protein
MARAGFQQELEELRLQLELLTARVSVALSTMHDVLRSGDPELAARALADDDHIDAMVVSLTERTYDLIRREAPVAFDLRYLVSVLRVLEELERVGDLSLRVVKQAPDQPLLAEFPRIFGILDGMATVAEELFRVGLNAWTSQDATLAGDVRDRSLAMDDHYKALLDEVLVLEGPGAVPVAVTAVLMGRAFDRIADHTVVVGERLGYLLTGDPAYLASEVR